MDEKSIEKLALIYLEYNEKLETSQKALSAIKTQIENYNKTPIVGCDLAVIIPLVNHLNESEFLLAEAILQIEKERNFAKKELAQQIKEICAN